MFKTSRFLRTVILPIALISVETNAQDIKSEASDHGVYVFVTSGLASHDANLDTAVSSGSLSLSRTTDDEGTVTTVGVGWQRNENIAMEVYAGKIDGFGSTTTVAATNAVVAGSTLNGSLSVNEDVSSTLMGANAVFTDKARFANGSSLTLFGKIGLVNYKVKDDLSLSGSGTIDGVSYNISSPVFLTIEEKGTAASFGGGLSYATSDNLEISFGVNYIPEVGGGDLVKADLTTYDIGLAAKF
jgi:hypothetical protein